MYNVVLEYTREAGDYKGIRTWTSFASEEEFNQWYTEDVRKRERVIEKGVSEERCIEIARGTPLVCYVAAALKEATAVCRPGKFSKRVFVQKLTMAMVAKTGSFL